MERTTPSFIADVMARVLLQFVVATCQLVTDHVDHIFREERGAVKPLIKYPPNKGHLSIVDT
jgi:hypothetical protein